MLIPTNRPIADIGHDGSLPPFADAQIDSVVGLCRNIIDCQASSRDNIAQAKE